MELPKPIDVAPKNGDFIILQDACSWELGRWDQEANGWVKPDGAPVRISPTHWTRAADDVAGATDREHLLFLAGPLPDDETEQPRKRPLTRLILASVTAILCIGGFVFWIGSEGSSSDHPAADSRASVAIGSLTDARERENAAQALEAKQIADAKQKEMKQALDESEKRSEALTRELASVRENDVAARNLAAARERDVAQALEAKQITDAKQKELKQALDESEKRSEALTRELASVRENDVAARNLAAARERDVAQALEAKQITDAKQKELKQALDESEKRSEALTRELASVRENDVAARNLAAARERDVAQALEAKQIADTKQKELKQALDESEKRSEALTRELASVRGNDVAARNLAATRERENAAQALEAKQITDAKQKELKQALDESEKRSEALARELASVRGNDVAARNLAAARERDAAQALEAKQIVDAKQKEMKQALDESERRAFALEGELASARKTIASAAKPSNAEVTARDAAQALEAKQIADARQKELKQALDESERRAFALEGELASARKTIASAAKPSNAEVTARDAAQALEAKQIADARQKELKQALDESERRAFALEGELASARKTIASAAKPSNAEVTARDAASPTGPLNRPMEGSNAAIAASITTPQSGDNITPGVQVSSDATPADATATAGASGQLTRSNQSQPGRPQPPSAMSSAEEATLVARAESLIRQYNFVGARLLLAHAVEKGSARAAFVMAKTYDWRILRSLRAYGVRGDAAMARELYQLAVAAGIETAQERVDALQSDATVDPQVGGERRSRPESRQRGRFASPNGPF